MVGGVSLFGGRGRLVYAVVGALVLPVIENGLLLGLPAGVYLATAGGVLILAATVDELARGGGFRRVSAAVDHRSNDEGAGAVRRPLLLFGRGDRI